MVIYELGLVSHGLPIVSKQYYKEYEVDPTLRGGFLSALNAFAEEVFSDSIDSFSMKNFTIVLLTIPFGVYGTINITAYCIGDKKVNLKQAKEALTKTLRAFNTQFGHLESLSCDLALFEPFKEVIDGILGDLAKKPDDRARSIFG